MPVVEADGPSPAPRTDFGRRETHGPAYAGIRSFMRLPLLHGDDLSGVDCAVLGAPLDSGSSIRVGARFGPEAIRSASITLRPFHPGLAVDLAASLSIVDAGDAAVPPVDPARGVEVIATRVATLAGHGVVPLVLGGDQTVSLGVLSGLASVHGTHALLLFDSHTDTHSSFYGGGIGHSTPFLRAIESNAVDPTASTMFGIRGSTFNESDEVAAPELGYRVRSATDLREGWNPAAEISEALTRAGQLPIYVSFDLDFLDPAFAPGVGSPEIGGFSTYEALQMLRSLATLGDEARLSGGDVVECVPAYDCGDVTALAAATIAHELLAVVAKSRRRA